MTSPLENLCGPGKPLAEEPRDEREFAELKRAALVRLRDAQSTDHTEARRNRHSTAIKITVALVTSDFAARARNHIAPTR